MKKSLLLLLTIFTLGIAVPTATVFAQSYGSSQAVEQTYEVKIYYKSEYKGKTTIMATSAAEAEERAISKWIAKYAPKDPGRVSANASLK